MVDTEDKATSERLIVVAHEDERIAARVREALAPHRVVWVATSDVLDRDLPALDPNVVLLRHPFGSEGAKAVLSSIRKTTDCSVVVIAEDSTDEECDALAEELALIVLPTLEPFLESILRARNEEQGREALGEEAEIEEEGVATEEPAEQATTLASVPQDEVSGTATQELAAVGQSLGEDVVALKLDQDSCDRWLPLDLPARLVALLDGTRTPAEVAANAGIPISQAMDYLRLLADADCLANGPQAAPTEQPDDPGPPVSSWLPADTSTDSAEFGSFDETPPPKLLLDLSARRFTGTLTVRSRSWTLRLDIVQGSPVGGRGGPDETGLARTMLRLRYIDEDKLTKLIEARRSADRSMGELAVQMGIVRPDQVLAALWAQTDAKIRALLKLEEGNYIVHRDPGVTGHAVGEQMVIEAVIADTLRKEVPTRNRLISAFLAIQGNRRVGITSQVGELLPRFRFGGKVQRLLRLLGDRTVSQAIEESPLPREEAELAIYLLHAAGGLRPM